MRQGPRLEANLTTGLRIHPGVQLALRFLQVPTQELAALVDQELLSNPLLEVDEEAEAKLSALEPEPRDDAEQEPRFLDEDEPLVPRGQLEILEPMEWNPAAEPTLIDQLRAQLVLRVSTLEARRAAEFLLGCLDERGFIGCELAEAAKELSLPLSAVEAGLALLQELEPAGVGARDLKECLLLQLTARGLGDSMAGRLIREQFDPLLHGRFAEIGRAIHVSREEIDAACRDIRRLSPSPGRLVAPGEVRYIYPDLVVERVTNGYEVWVNDRAAPRLRMNGQSRRLLQEVEGAGEQEAREFLRERARSARWLIQALERRRETMLRVMRSIVAEQREFLDKGIAHLKPMTLRAIAGQVGLHESTVARVTSAKYVQTPRGVFPLKFFFSSHLATQGGEEISARSVRERIRAMIAEEDRTQPWSDEALARALGGEGIRIARRTVAKYREQMKIERAQLRRRGDGGGGHSAAA